MQIIFLEFRLLYVVWGDSSSIFDEFLMIWILVMILVINVALFTNDRSMCWLDYTISDSLSLYYRRLKIASSTVSVAVPRCCGIPRGCRIISNTCSGAPFARGWYKQWHNNYNQQCMHKSVSHPPRHCNILHFPINTMLRVSTIWLQFGNKNRPSTDTPQSPSTYQPIEHVSAVVLRTFAWMEHSIACSLFGKSVDV